MNINCDSEKIEDIQQLNKTKLFLSIKDLCFSVPLSVDEGITEIEITLEPSDYDYKKCKYSLQNISPNIKKILLNIRSPFQQRLETDRWGNLTTTIYSLIYLGDYREPYTLEELLNDIRLPFGCDLKYTFFQGKKK
jgi:hypothetical protein